MKRGLQWLAIVIWNIAALGLAFTGFGVMVGMLERNPAAFWFR